jgi:hypothetical protein
MALIDTASTLNLNDRVAALEQAVDGLVSIVNDLTALQAQRFETTTSPLQATV